MHSLLVGRHLDEEVATRNIASSLAHTRFVIIVAAAIVHRRRTIGTASIARHSDLDRMRVQLSSIHHGVGSTNDERSILSGIERISDGNGGRRAGMSVDHLVTRLRWRIRTSNHFQSIRYTAHSELFHVTGVDRVSPTEVLTCRDMRRSRHRNLLGWDLHVATQQNCQEYDKPSNMFHRVIFL